MLPGMKTAAATALAGTVRQRNAVEVVKLTQMQASLMA